MRSSFTADTGCVISARLSMVVLSVLLAGCGPKQLTEPVAKSERSTASSPDRVTAGPPVKKTLQLFTDQPGRVVAFEETPILSKVAGYVESVHFDIGEKVMKGQVLIHIRAPEYTDQLEQKRGLRGQAEAQAKQAEAALVAAEAAANSSKSLIAQAEAGISKTESDYARWSSEFKRIQQLVGKGSVTNKLADETSSQLESADAARKEALASIESAKARLNEAEANVLTAKADIDAAKAKLRVSDSDVALAETMLAYTELVAPFDGFVTSRNADVGHYVQPAGASNGLPLMTIANVSRLRVCVNVPESEASWVDAGFGSAGAGDLATIFSANLPGGKIESRVARTSLQLDPQSRTLTAEIDLANADLKLLAGAFVTTKILLEQRENVLALPIGAIVKASDGTKCCLVIDGKIQHRPVELGLRVGDEVEIKSGIDVTDTVVLIRAGGLQVGQSVEIITSKR